MLSCNVGQCYALLGDVLCGDERGASDCDAMQGSVVYCNTRRDNVMLCDGLRDVITHSEAEYLSGNITWCTVSY